MKMFLKILIYSIPAILVAYLFYHNTKPVLDLNYNLKNATPMFSNLVPLARVSDVQEDNLGFYRVINQEPVYFDLRLPRKYDQVKVAIEYSDLKNDIFKIGVARDIGREVFDFISLTDYFVEVGGVKKATVEFSITDIPTPYRKLRFMLALPNNGGNGDLVKIRSIKVQFTGQKFGWNKIIEKIKNAL